MAKAVYLSEIAIDNLQYQGLQWFGVDPLEFGLYYFIYLYMSAWCQGGSHSCTYYSIKLLIISKEGP